MEDKKYHGWTNYETWVVISWLENDEQSLAWLNELSAEDRELHEKAHRLEQQIFMDVPEAVVRPASMFSDLLTVSMEKINWREIVQHAEETYYAEGV